MYTLLQEVDPEEIGVSDPSIVPLIIGITPALVIAYVVYRDASKREKERELAWAVAIVLTGFSGVIAPIVVGLLYYTVRN